MTFERIVPSDSRPSGPEMGMVALESERSGPPMGRFQILDW